MISVLFILCLLDALGHAHLIKCCGEVQKNVSSGAFSNQENVAKLYQIPRENMRISLKISFYEIAYLSGFW